MAERDQLPGPLGRHHSGHFGHRQHVALATACAGHQLVRLARHPHRALGDRGALALGLVRRRPPSGRGPPRPGGSASQHLRQLLAQHGEQELGVHVSLRRLARLGHALHGAGAAARGRPCRSSAGRHRPPRRLSQRAPRRLAQRIGQRVEHGGELAPRRERRLLERPLVGAAADPASTASSSCSGRAVGLAGLLARRSSASPMEPAASATRSSSCSARSSAARACSVRNPRTSSSVSRLSRTGTARDRIVGSSRRGSTVVRMNRLPAGGSSSSLSSALAAS